MTAAGPQREFSQDLRSHGSRSAGAACHLRSRHYRELLFVAELVGRVGGGHREHCRRDFFQIPFLLSRDTAGVKQVLRKYRDRKIDLADACLIGLADQFGTGDILTLDHDFAIYRWGKNKPFRVLLNVDLLRPGAKP
jgi:hypothetical protein